MPMMSLQVDISIDGERFSTENGSSHGSLWGLAQTYPGRGPGSVALLPLDSQDLDWPAVILVHSNFRGFLKL